MDIQALNMLFVDGTLKEMLNDGFISSKVFLHRDIYLWVDAQVKARGISKNKAVLEAEVVFKLSERTIWQALKSFSK